VVGAASANGERNDQKRKDTKFFHGSQERMLPRVFLGSMYRRGLLVFGEQIRTHDLPVSQGHVSAVGRGFHVLIAPIRTVSIVES